MVAYNQRILATSQSPQRRHRADRMLANLTPLVAQLEHDEASPPNPKDEPRTIVSDGVEFEATSIGAHSLTNWPEEESGSKGSSLSGRTFGVRH